MTAGSCMHQRWTGCNDRRHLLQQDNVLKLTETIIDASCAGHSLGGGYALCTFLQLLASADDLSSSILLGGVYTFGAPLVASPDDASQAIQMMYREQHQAARYSQNLPHLL